MTPEQMIESLIGQARDGYVTAEDAAKSVLVLFTSGKLKVVSHDVTSEMEYAGSHALGMGGVYETIWKAMLEAAP